MTPLFTLERLYAAILRLTARRKLFVAYSGGVDSHVLLHGLVKILHADTTSQDTSLAAFLAASNLAHPVNPCFSRSHLDSRTYTYLPYSHSNFHHCSPRCSPSAFAITAVHINHGLHSDADVWEKHCQQTCAALNIPCIVRRVAVTAHLKRKDNLGLEAVARHLRYTAFREIVPHDAALLTAHHADDQTETVLLQLLRGAGVKGLAAIPAKSWLGSDDGVRAYSGIGGDLQAIYAQCPELLRPLLGFARDDLLRYANEQQLRWVEDGSNLDISINRNYLRQQIVPLLKQRWSSLPQTLARVATNCYEAQCLITELAAMDMSVTSAAIADSSEALNSHLDGNANSNSSNGVYLARNTLDIDALRQLTPLRQRNVLRYFLHNLRLPLPSRVKLLEIQRCILHSADDAQAEVRWRGAEVRRYRGRLYAMLPFLPHDSRVVLPWDDITLPLALPAGLGVLRILRREVAAEMAVGATEIEKLQGVKYAVRFRQGGERCRVKGKQHSSALKKLMQDWCIPPWLRDRIPLLYRDEEIVAVVGYCECAGWDAKLKLVSM